MELIKNIDKETPFNLAGAVEAEPGKVNSLTFAQMPGVKVTLFAIAEGERIPGHAAPGDAMVNVLEGTGGITINDVEHELHAGESIVIPKGAPHALRGISTFKMLLVVVLPA